MNEEEAAVLRALEEAEEPLAHVWTKRRRHFQKGGRIVYVGAARAGDLR